MLCNWILPLFDPFFTIPSPWTEIFPLTWMTNSHLLPQEEFSLWEHLFHGGIPSPYSHTSINHVPLFFVPIFLWLLFHLAYSSLIYLITHYPPNRLWAPAHRNYDVSLCPLAHVIYSNNPTRLGNVMRKYKILNDANETMVWSEALKQTIETNYLGEKYM